MSEDPSTGILGRARGGGEGEEVTHHHLDVASVLTLVCSGGSGRRVRQRRSKAWDDTPEGVDDGTQGWSERGRPGLSFGSGVGVSAGVIVTQDKRSGWMLVSGPDGSVHMPPCRVVGCQG